MFCAQRPLESYCSKFESVCMALAHSTVAHWQKQALSTICAGVVVCNTQISGPSDCSRGRRHCVGFAWGHRLYLAQSLQPESTGWRPAGRQSRVFTPVGVFLLTKMFTQSAVYICLTSKWFEHYSSLVYTLSAQSYNRMHSYLQPCAQKARQEEETVSWFCLEFHSFQMYLLISVRIRQSLNPKP